MVKVTETVITLTAKSSLKYGGAKPAGRQEEDESEKDSKAELTKLEVELCKQNFSFYDKIR